MKTYQAIYEPNKNKGVYGISLVENPAMEGLFIALSKDEKIQLKTLDDEKRILIGLVLEPDKPIYRNQGGEEFNIIFSSQTIEDLCYGFTKNKNNSNSTIEHDKKIEGVTFVENWLVRDEKIDTSVSLGLECKKGSWVSVMKVDSDDVWSDYVKTGKVQGFSIDAMLSLKEVNLKSEINMSEHKTIADAISEGFNQFLTVLKGQKEPVKIELGEVKSADGNITIMFDGETMEVGGQVWIVAEDETKVPLPAGEYPLENNTSLIVKEDGIIAEVKEYSQEPAPEATAQAPAEMTAKESDATARAIENAIKSIMIKYSDDQNKVIDELKAELKETKEQLVNLSSQPASKPAKSAPQISEPKNSKERILSEIQKH